MFFCLMGKISIPYAERPTTIMAKTNCAMRMGRSSPNAILLDFGYRKLLRYVVFLVLRNVVVTRVLCTYKVGCNLCARNERMNGIDC